MRLRGLVCLGLILSAGSTFADKVKPWTPPQTKISKKYVEVTKALLGNGLEDPRGGVFSRLIVERFRDRDGKVTEGVAFGWAMEKNRYVTTSGTSATFLRNERPALMSELYRSAASNDPNVILIHPGLNYVTPVTAALPALLLIRGEVLLAEQCLGEVKSGAASALAREVAQRLFQQILNLYSAGKLKESLAVTRTLAKVRPIYFETALEEKVPGPLPTLQDEFIAKEIERRLKNPVKPVDLKAIAKLPQPDRIKQLILGLEQVQPTMVFIPGGEIFNGNPIFQALLKEGDAAVEPVLEAIATDERMTGSLKSARHGPPQNLIPVRQVAAQLFTALWPQSEYIRAQPWFVWQRHKRLSDAERWLDILQDDSLDWQGWRRAAERLVQPDMSRTRNNGEPVNPKVLGRDLPNDAFVDTLMRRSLELTQSTQVGGSRVQWEHGAGLRIAALLAGYEAKKTPLTFFQEISRRTLAFAGKISEQRVVADWAPQFASLISERVRAGDETAITDYRQFLRIGSDPTLAQMGFYQPLYTGRAKPEYMALAREIYAGLQKKLSGDGDVTASELRICAFNLIATPLIKTPEFRHFLADSISIDQHAAETRAKVTSAGVVVEIEYENGYTSTIPKEIDRTQIVEKDQPITVGDLVAYAVSELEGSPRYLPVLRPEIRAQKRKEMQAWLRDEKVDWKSRVTRYMWAWERE